MAAKTKGRRKVEPVPAPPERVALSTVEAAAALGVGESTVRAMLARGDLPRVYVGRRVRISRTAIDDYMARGGNPQPLAPYGGKSA